MAASFSGTAVGDGEAEATGATATGTVGFWGWPVTAVPPLGAPGAAGDAQPNSSTITRTRGNEQRDSRTRSLCTARAVGRPGADRRSDHSASRGAGASILLAGEPSKLRAKSDGRKRGRAWWQRRLSSRRQS